MVGISGLPKMIGVIDAAEQGGCGATRAVLADFEDALLAYDRASNTSTSAEGAESPRFAHGRFETCDALVVAFENTPAVEALSMVARLAPTRVYGICVTSGTVELEDENRFYPLISACEDAGDTWCGGILLPHAGLIARQSRSPRMGFMRRPRSETTDRLIAGVRAGLTVEQAARTFGATPQQLDAAKRNLILARSPLPAWLLK